MTTPAEPLPRRALGRTGQVVSRVILGCGSIGGIGSPAVSRGRGLSADEGTAQIDTAVGLGVNVLDTAIAYAGGESERVVGRWRAAHPDADVLVATKAGLPVPPGEPEIFLTPHQIADQFETSRARLGRVDLYLAHRPDEHTPIEETLEAFAALTADGRVRAVGVCNVDARGLEHALAAADRLGVPGYQWIQNTYNLLAREDERDLLPLVRDRGLGYTPSSPLAAGLLAGRYRPGEPAPPESRYAVFATPVPDTDDPLWRAMDGLESLARQREVSVPALALAWVLTHPDVTAPLVAPRRPGQFADVTAARHIDLDADARAEIAALFETR